MIASTTTVLQTAVQEQLRQFEPQLLPLFRHSRNGREPAATPTAHTHATLKTLVALTRYFPEEHRVRKAGKQLELIWPPLVHEPRGAVAGKLLHYYFQVRQDLLEAPPTALRLALQELVASAIDAARLEPEAARSRECLRRLHLLAAFLPDVVPQAVDAMTPLAQLFRWQQQLELAAAGTAGWQRMAHTALAPYRHSARERSAGLFAGSDWSLDYYCQAGLAHSLWQARGIALLAGDTAAAELLEELDDQCLDLHLAGQRPAAGALQSWLAHLFEGRDPDRAAGGDAAAAALDAGLHALYLQELAAYQARLRAALAQGAPLPVSAELITLLYKVAWLFTVAGHQSWARLGHCAYRVFVQYWRGRRPLHPECQAVVSAMADTLGSEVPVVQLRRWNRRLLQHWPGWAGDGKRPIALGAGAEQAVPLAAVPRLLSASFATLVNVAAEPRAASAAACRQVLQELVLLEHGAAAMKVWPLEQLCTALIAVYETHLRDGVELPAVLAPAHRQLVCMLDQSAAWQEAPGDAALLQALEDWLAQQSGGREPAAADADGDADSSVRRLRADLLAYLGTLAAVLERPVRLQLAAGGVPLAAERLVQVLECLKPLVKFLLLDRSVDTRSRHAMHKPRVSTLTVTLRATGSTLVLSAGEDSHEDALPHAEVQRLQRRLPKCAGPLVCESRAGQGRCFTVTLA